MAQGTVKWFNGEKGFGFISPDGSGPELVHGSALGTGLATWGLGASSTAATRRAGQGTSWRHLDARRLLHHVRGLGRRQHGRVEAGGVVTQRFPQLRDSHAHSDANRPKGATYRGK